MSRVRLDGLSLADAMEDTRTLARERGLSSVVWWVGDAATPADIGERLLERGLERGDVTAALVLDRPPTGSAAFTARPAASLEEFSCAQELDWEAAGLPQDKRERIRSGLADSWKREGETGRTFVVLDGAEVISMGRSGYGEHVVFLTGGATAPEHRGRGAYTASVLARWDDAFVRGTPLLATQATPRSAPILRRLGFADVGTVTLYFDRF